LLNELKDKAMKLTNQKITDISSISTVTLDATSNVENYVLTGTKTISTNFEVVASGTPARDVLVYVWCVATLTTSGSPTFTVLGKTVQLDFLPRNFLAVAAYVNSSWNVIIAPLTPATGSSHISVDPATGALSITAGSIVNADVAAGAAIAYAKLALTGAILNADLAGSIAYAKLVLTGAVVNADIAAAAAIAFSKMAALSASKMLGTTAGGVIEALDTATYPSLTELAYIKGLTSAIQTQINAKISSGGGAIVNADVNAAAAIALSKLAALTASKLIASDASGIIVSLDTATYPSLTELSYVKGLTSALQTQLNAISARSGNGGSYVLSAAATIVLDAAAADSYKLNTTSNAIAVTLPDADLFPEGFGISIMQVFSGGTDKVVVSPASGDTLEVLTGVLAASYTYSATGEVHIYKSNSVDKWIMF
jgi:hypothetical protein